MLGANCDNHDSVHGSRKSLGAEHWVGKIFGVCTLWESSKTHTRLGGVIQRKLVRTIFDN